MEKEKREDNSQLDKKKQECNEIKKKNNREYMKDLRENFREEYNEYQRNYMRQWRANKSKKKSGRPAQPKKELSREESEKNKEERKNYMHNYFQRPEIKERRREYCREYMGDKREYDKVPEPGISFKEWRKMNKCAPKNSEANNLVNHIKEIKKYPSDFPRDEFDRRLDELLKDNPMGVEEKILQDIVYDILEKGKSSTMEKMVMVYNDPSWENAINCFMNSKEYFGEIIAGDKIYMNKRGNTKK
jgi:hypothetical protein